MFEVDGRLKGALDVKTVQCDQTANVCIVPVKAPGFALVFLTDSPVLEDEAPKTFGTSARTRTVNTVTIDPQLLATSNGHSGKDRAKMGSTSAGSNGAIGLGALVPGVLLFSILSGGVFVIMAGSYL